MGITSSQIISNSLQANNRRDITELHTDHLGNKYKFSYTVNADIDVNQRLLDRVASIENLIKQQELEKAISDIEHGREYKIDYSTDEELKTLLIERETEKQNMIDEINVEKVCISNKIVDIDSIKIKEII